MLPGASPDTPENPSAKGGKSPGILPDFSGIPAPGSQPPDVTPGYTAGHKSFKNQLKIIDFGVPELGIPAGIPPEFPGRGGNIGRGSNPTNRAHAFRITVVELTPSN